MALQLFKIETVEVASPVSSVTFSNIPQGYTDLKVEFSGRAGLAGGSPWHGMSIQFNSDTTSSNYPTRWIFGNGTGATSDNNNTARYFMWATNATATANTFSNCSGYIPNYKSSNYKSFSVDNITETNGVASVLLLLAGIWQSTDAITSITLSLPSETLIANSTITLYGVL